VTQPQREDATTRMVAPSGQKKGVDSCKEHTTSLPALQLTADDIAADRAARCWSLRKLLAIIDQADASAESYAGRPK